MTNAKREILRIIRRHGAIATIEALAAVLRDLGPAWRGDDGPATGIEAVTGYAPHAADDWRGAARCGECDACQEHILTPRQAPACTRGYSAGA